MPYTSSDGVNIHYQGVGEGPPLVLQHGWSNSVEYWHDFGYVEGLVNDFKLNLILARGHGESDIPSDADAYETKATASDIIAVLDRLEIGKAHFFGY